APVAVARPAAPSTVGAPGLGQARRDVRRWRGGTPRGRRRRRVRRLPGRPRLGRAHELRTPLGSLV
ncbi:MAG: Universal stress protein family, partial [uncultured Acidimicrobiales bacterium]